MTLRLLAAVARAATFVLTLLRDKVRRRQPEDAIAEVAIEVLYELECSVNLLELGLDPFPRHSNIPRETKLGWLYQQLNTALDLVDSHRDSTFCERAYKVMVRLNQVEIANANLRIEKAEAAQAGLVSA